MNHRIQLVYRNNGIFSFAGEIMRAEDEKQEINLEWPIIQLKRQIIKNENFTGSYTQHENLHNSTIQRHSCETLHGGIASRDRCRVE